MLMVNKKKTLQSRQQRTANQTGVSQIFTPDQAFLKYRARMMDELTSSNQALIIRQPGNYLKTSHRKLVKAWLDLVTDVK